MKRKTVEAGPPDQRAALKRAELAAQDSPDLEGTVSAVYADKGFGWLRGADGETRFFHADACDTDLYKLKPGDRLVFKHVDAPKGARAIQVRLVGPAVDENRGNRR